MIYQVNTLKDEIFSECRNEETVSFPSQLRAIPGGLTQYWLLLGQIRAETPMLRLNLVWRTSSAHVFSWSFPSFRGTTVLSFVLSSFFSFGCHVIFSLLFTHPSVSYPVVVFGCEIWVIEGFPVSKDPEMIPSLWSSIQMIICFFVCLFWLHPAARRFLVVQPGIESVPSKLEVQDPNHWTTRRSLNQFISSRDVVPASTPYLPIITLPSWPLHFQHFQVFL